MRRSFVLPPFRPASCAVPLACAVGFAAAATTQVQGTPQSGAPGSAPPATVAAAPTPQFPPLGTGLSAEERGTLQAAVDQLRKARGGAEEDVSGSADGRSRRRCRGLSRRGPSSVEVRRTALRAERQHAARERAADAGDRHRARRATRCRSHALDDDQRRARFLLRDRRLGAALHPDDAGQLRRGEPARRIASTCSCTGATTRCSSSSS